LKKNEWNEERIKVLLNQLPTVKDRRSAQQIYKQLLMAKQEKKTKKNWAWPVLATVAVLFLAILIAPEFLNGNQNASESTKNEPQKKETEASADTNVILQKEAAHKEHDEKITTMNEKSLVVPAEEANNFFTVAFTNAEMAAIIPISIPKATGTENINELIEKYDTLHFENIGLYKPAFYDHMKLQEVKENKKEVKVLLSKIDHLSSSAESEWFKNVFQETMKWGPYDRIQIEGSKKLTGDLLGGMDQIEINKQEKKGYLKYETDTGEKYLLPTEQTFSTIEEAFASMKDDSGAKQIKPLLPDGVTISPVQREGRELIVNFSGKKEQIKQTDDLTMLEGILLTAKDFGYKKVLFTNLPENRIGAYDVTKPIDVPAAPNPIEINR
jgi:hypothetical protein